MRIIELDDIARCGEGLFYHLTDAQLRSKQRPQDAVVIAEGPKVVLSALEAGLRPLSLLMRRKMITGPGAEIIARCGDIPVYTGDDDVLADLTGFRLQRAWVLCAFQRPPLRTAEEIAASGRRIAVLEGINEPSNVGAVFRSAAALGMDGILLTPDCCDPMHRRAVRVCMGTVFLLPWAYTDEDHGLSLLKQKGFRLIAMALREDSVSLNDLAFSLDERAAIYLGTEDTGLREDTVRGCDTVVRIPMRKGVDSLNVAAAAALAFWQAAR